MVSERAIRSVLAPVNGSAGDERLLQMISRICEARSARITLVYVVEVAQAMPIDADLPSDVARGESVLFAAEQRLRDLIGARHSPGIMTELLQARSAGAAIVDEAIEQNVDAIVMVTDNRLERGKTTVGESVPYVFRHAPCEVIVIRTVDQVDGERR
jgi:nucleotide-binding universal stress UspA family protein